MTIQRNFGDYHRSIAEELNAKKDRIRNLIGDNHWLSDGEHKETILRNVLRDLLPETYKVSKGFICGKEITSSQIDILITYNNRPTLYKEGELVIVTPDAVHAVLEIKTRLNSRSEIKECLTRLSNNIYLVRKGLEDSYPIGGLYVYDDTSVTDEDILSVLHELAQKDMERTLNFIAFGPNRFFRFWKNMGNAGNNLTTAPGWHSYNLPDGMAQSYFCSNINLYYESNEDLVSQYAWFPLETGKELHRKQYVELLGDGVINDF